MRRRRHHSWNLQPIPEQVNGVPFKVYRCPHCKCKRYGSGRWLPLDRPLSEGFIKVTPECR